MTTPMGLEATEAASGLDYTRASDVAFSCLGLVASNSTGHLGPNKAVVGKDSTRDGAILRVGSSQGYPGDVPTWPSAELGRCPCTCSARPPSFPHSCGEDPQSTSTKPGVSWVPNYSISAHNWLFLSAAFPRKLRHRGKSMGVQSVNSGVRTQCQQLSQNTIPAR